MATMFFMIVLLAIYTYCIFTIGRLVEMNAQIKEAEKEIKRLENELEAMLDEIIEETFGGVDDDESKAN